MTVAFRFQPLSRLSSYFHEMNLTHSLTPSLLLPGLQPFSYLLFIFIILAAQPSGKSWMEWQTRTALGPDRLLGFIAISLVIARILMSARPCLVVNCLAYPGRNSLEIFISQILFATGTNLALRRGVGLGTFSELATVVICFAGPYLTAWFVEKRR